MGGCVLEVQEGWERKTFTDIDVDYFLIQNDIAKFVTDYPILRKKQLGRGTGPSVTVQISDDGK